MTAIGNVGVTIATQLFFDQAIHVAEKGGIGGNILFGLLLVLFVRVLVTFTEVTFNVYGRNMLKNLERLFDCKMHEKLARFDPIEFEKPEVLDRINRARYGIRGSTSLIFVAVHMFTLLPVFLYYGDLSGANGSITSTGYPAVCTARLVGILSACRRLQTDGNTGNTLSKEI